MKLWILVDGLPDYINISLFFYIIMGEKVHVEMVFWDGQILAIFTLHLAPVGQQSFK